MADIKPQAGALSPGVLVVKKGSNIWSWISLGIPGPLSLISTTASFLPVSMQADFPLAIHLRSLSMLVQTWLTHFRSFNQRQVLGMASDGQ